MNVIIRADSGSCIGTGHIMRCLTLALALRNEGHEVVFVTKPHDGNIIDKVYQSGFKVIRLSFGDSGTEDDLIHSKWLGGSQVNDAEQTINFIMDSFGQKVGLVIVDHYGIDHRWERIVSSWSEKIMIIDDLADREHCCNYLLDQTVKRDKTEYLSLVPNDCQFLLGSSYALLREEFQISEEYLRIAREKSKQRRASKVLVMMGGTDPYNISAKILDALSFDEESECITVVLGSTAPHIKEIEEYCKRDKRITILTGVSNVAELMLEHDICFGAAGTASWERCAMWLPSILVAFAENQQKVLAALNQIGAASVFTMDDSSHFILSILKQLRDPQKYQNMFEKASQVCDGFGVSRVIKTINSDNIQTNVFLDKATLIDKDVVFEWQCDPITRKFFRNTEVPTWEEHDIWFDKKINTPKDYFYIVRNSNDINQPVGVVRLDYINDNAYEVSILVAPSMYGKGIGYQSLMLLDKMHPQITIYAEVDENNIASQRIFEKSGYIRLDRRHFVKSQS